MESIDKDKIKLVSNKFILIITVISMLLIIALFVFQWFYVKNHFELLKNEQLKTKSAQKDVSTFYFEFKKTNDKQIILSPAEFKKMYEHVNGLAEKVSEESQRTKDIINQDIDRLNLYMAIGIGFISILGIFVPILVNILSFDDLKNKQKIQDDKLNSFESKEVILSAKINSLDESVKKIPLAELNSAIEKSQKVDIIAQTVTKLENTINETIPEVSVMIFQTAVIRFFYLSPILMSNLIREQDGTTLASLVESIKDGLINCNRTNTNKDVNFQTALRDFKLFIGDTRFHTSFLNVAMTQNYVRLSGLIGHYIEGQDVIVNIEEIFNAIITQLKEYAQTEPAIAQN